MSDLDSFEDLRLRVSDPGPLNLRTWRCGRRRPSTQLCFQDGSRRATTRCHEVVDWPEAPQVAHSTSQSAMPSSAVQSSPQQPGQLPKDMAFIIIMLPPKYDAGLALPSCEMERERGSVFPRGRWTEGPGEGQKGSVLESESSNDTAQPRSHGPSDSRTSAITVHCGNRASSVSALSLGSCFWILLGLNCPVVLQNRDCARDGELPTLQHDPYQLQLG